MLPSEDASHVAQLAALSRFARDVREESLSARSAAPLTAEEQDQLCTICYAHAARTRFVPCGHRSCAQCIQRQMLAAPTCFFCKQAVERVEEEEDVAVAKTPAAAAAALDIGAAAVEVVAIPAVDTVAESVVDSAEDTVSTSVASETSSGEL